MIAANDEPATIGLHCRAVSSVSRFAASHAYYLALFLYSAITWLGRTELFHIPGTTWADGVETVVHLLVVALLVMAGCVQRARLGEWAVGCAIAVVAFVAWRTSGEGWLFWIALFVVFGKGVDMRRAAGAVLASVGAVTVVTVCLAVLGVVDNNEHVRTGVELVRRSLGFVHPNNFASAVMTLCVALCVVLYRDGDTRRLAGSVAGCAAGAALTLLAAGSRTSALCLVLLALLLVVQFVARKLGAERPVVIGCAVLFAAAAVASLALLVFYNQDNAVMAWLNNLLTGRLRLAHVAFVDHAPGMFGYAYAEGTTTVIDGTSYTFVVDNMYDHIILRFGVLAWLAFVIGVALFYVKAAREHYFGVTLFLMTLFMVFGFSETHGCRVECNFLIVALSCVLYRMPLASLDGDYAGEREGLLLREIPGALLGAVRKRAGE